MSQPVPRQHYRIESVHQGSPSSTAYVDQGTCNSLLLSEGHYILRSGGWSGGGPFFQVSDTLTHSGPIQFPGYTWIIPRDPSDAIGVAGVDWHFTKPDPTVLLSGWSGEQARSFTYAATGYRRTRPGNPTGSLGQFLVELRDLPKLPLQGRKTYVSLFKRGLSLDGIMHYARSYASDFRNLGSEYLNYQFGWRPFVGDLRRIYNTWKNIDKQMAAIIRNNGRGVRRSAQLDNTSTITDSSEASYAYPGANVGGFPGELVHAGGSTRWTKVSKVEEKVWYSAKYRYYIPDVSSSQWNARARLALFGALPTPELIWEVIPFSWLIDWAVNVGDVVSNVSMNAVDNLVQLYSFIMRQRTETETATAETSWGPWFSIPPGSFTFTSEKKRVTKTRTGGGSPYALNAVSGAPLSGYQAGILAALGISRVPT